MIDEALLRSAAAKSIAKHVAAVEANLVPMERHVFSEQFERKIRKLTKRANHPVLYHAVKRVASVLLAIILTGSVLLAIDVEVRAAFVGWVKEVYGTFFVYRFVGEEAEAEPVRYRLGYVPDGYIEFYIDISSESNVFIYTNDEGKLLKFNYVSAPDETDWVLISTSLRKKHTEVNGIPAELLISDDPAVAGGILWMTADNTGFYISGYFSEDEMVKIAENVEIVK